MSLIPDFVPMEMEGMSIITALCLFFFISGGVIVFRCLINRCNEHDTTINSIKKDLNDMKVDVAETVVVVKGIEKSLTEITKSNRHVSEMLMKR